jgi:hypothetical protein
LHWTEFEGVMKKLPTPLMERPAGDHRVAPTEMLRCALTVTAIAMATVFAAGAA